MSVGSNLIGQVFDYTRYSAGAVDDPNANPIVYTEVQPVPASPQLSLAVTNVSTDAQGATTVTLAGGLFSVITGSDITTATATAIGNNSDAVLVEGNVGVGGNSINFVLLLTNTAALQPGVGKKTSVFNESQSVAYNPLCFASGTRFRTLHGDVAVENLSVGDLVSTASGAMRPIRWLGHRRIDCRARACPTSAWPVRVAAHAFGADLPTRDLYMSPGHPVLVGADATAASGWLVPIMCLINGTTIERVPVDEIIYWHVELETHDILFAEGLPAESYIDLGSRDWFAGADGVLNDPDFVVPAMPGRCRPVIVDGPVVEAERRRLDMVLATRLGRACAWPGSEDVSVID